MGLIYRVIKTHKQVNNKYRKVLTIQVFKDMNSRGVWNDYMTADYDYTSLTELKKNMKKFPALVYKFAFEVLKDKDGSMNRDTFLNQRGGILEDRYYVPQWVSVLVQKRKALVKFRKTMGSGIFAYYADFRVTGRKELMDQFDNVYKFEEEDLEVEMYKKYHLTVNRGQTYIHEFNRVDVSENTYHSNVAQVWNYVNDDKFKEMHKSILKEVPEYRRDDKLFWEDQLDCNEHMVFGRMAEIGYGFLMINYDETSNLYGTSFFVPVNEYPNLKAIGHLVDEDDMDDTGEVKIPYFSHVNSEGDPYPLVRRGEFRRAGLIFKNIEPVIKIEGEKGGRAGLYFEDGKFFWVAYDHRLRVNHLRSYSDPNFNSFFSSDRIGAGRIYFFANRQEAMIASIAMDKKCEDMLPAVYKLLGMK